MTGELTYTRLKEAWKILESSAPPEYRVWMTVDEMAERGYSDLQIERMVSSGDFEVPDDKEKFDTWFRGVLNSRKRE